MMDAQYRITIDPTPRELGIWWETMRGDESGTAWFSDAFPSTFADFVFILESGEERCALFFDGNEVAGAYWLHDLRERTDEAPAYAWVRGYVAPDYRGTFTDIAWPMARQAFGNMGYHHIFAASHPNNKAAHGCLTKNMHFSVVGHYEPFCSFQGKPGACVVYSMLPEDEDLARRDATQRVEECLAAVL